MKTDWYPMEYEAWDEGTDGLTLEQEAAYLRICHQMYRRRSAIPDNPNTLARVFRVHPNKAKAIIAALVSAKKITTQGGYLTNTRVMSELHHRDTIRTKRADAGRVGGTSTGQNLSKSLKTNTVDEAIASDVRKQNEAHNTTGQDRTGQKKALDAQGALAIEGKPEKKKRQPKVTLTIIDPNWRMGEDQIEYSKRIGMTGVEAGREWKKFKGHHQAKGTRFADWNAAWQNWARRALEYMGRSPKDEPPAGNVAAVDRTRSDWETIVRIYKNTNNWVREWGPPPGEPGCMVPGDLIGERLL